MALEPFMLFYSTIALLAFSEMTSGSVCVCVCVWRGTYSLHLMRFADEIK